MSLKQSIDLKSVKNARELGGYTAADGRKIKKGVLLRTANLSGISEKDMRVLTGTYHVSHIVDFRLDMEIKGFEDPAVSGAEYHHLDVIDLSTLTTQDTNQVDFSSLTIEKIVELSEQMGMLNDKMYIGFLISEAGKKAFSEFFRILLSAEPDTAVLWHCTSGKDRTGIAAMLLLSALDVEEDVIIDDYLLTNVYNAQKIEATRQYMKAQGYDDVFVEKAVSVFDSVDERFMRNAVAYLDKAYGSAEGYIREALNISQEDIDSLKEKYLV